MTVQGGGRSYVRRMLSRLEDVRVNAPVLRVPALSMTGCHWHPSVTDQQLLAGLSGSIKSTLHLRSTK